MGYNTTLVILNDGLSDLEKPDAGKRILGAIYNLRERDFQRDRNPGKSYNHLTNFGFGSAIEQHHADDTAVITVGGNTGRVLHQTFGYDHGSEALQLRILQELADKMGYRLVRKAGRK